MKRVTIAVAALCAVGAGAEAQQDPMRMSSHQAEVQLADYTDCVVAQKTYRAAVDRFLRVIPESEAFYPASLKAADMHCLDGAARRSGGKIEMRMQPAAFRAALYPALYRRDFGKAGPVAGIADVPPMALATEFDGDVATLAPDYRPTRALGDCVVRETPQAAHALTIAMPYSRQDDLAVDLLKPALATCLSEGRTVRINRTVLRAATGEAMYKLSRATTGGPR